MDEKSAWNKFLLTGKVQDYLSYTFVKEKELEENKCFENQYDRTCAFRTKRRRK